MDLELKQLEEELERLAPAGLAEGLIARLDAAMAAWQDAAPEAEEKVVPFPQSGPIAKTGGLSRGFMAAAAVVAFLGAVLALVVSKERPGGQTASQPDREPDYAAVVFAPTTLDRNIVQASDGGVVFTKDSQPHRLVRVEYMDHIEFRNEAGEILQVQKPSVNLVLIPVTTD